MSWTPGPPSGTDSPSDGPGGKFGRTVPTTTWLHTEPGIPLARRHHGGGRGRANRMAPALEESSMDARLIRLGLAVPVVPLLPLSAVAQSPKAGGGTTLQGRAIVTRAALPQPAAPRFKDDLFVRDQ